MVEILTEKIILIFMGILWLILTELIFFKLRWIQYPEGFIIKKLGSMAIAMVIVVGLFVVIASAFVILKEIGLTGIMVILFILAFFGVNYCIEKYIEKKNEK